MNNLFDIKRFGLVLRKDLKENLTRYLMYFGVLTGVLFLFFVLFNQHPHSYIYEYGIEVKAYQNANKLLLSISMTAFTCGAILAASMIMKPMNEKIKRISYLILPASSLEKFLSRWLIVTVGYLLLFFAAMYIADFLFMCYWKFRFSPFFEIHWIDLRELYTLKNGYEVFFEFSYFVLSLTVFYLVQSIFVLGATFRSRNSFPKTFFAVAAVINVYLYICNNVINLFYENNLNGFGHVMESFFYKGSALNPDPDGEIPVWIFCTLAFFTLFNWVIAYFRFREQELTEKL
jgi:hypothetical protein